MPRSSKRPLSYVFSHQNHVWLSPQTCIFNMSRLPHPPWFDYPNDIWWEEQITALLNAYYFLTFCYVQNVSHCETRKLIVTRHSFKKLTIHAHCRMFTTFGLTKEKTSYRIFSGYNLFLELLSAALLLIFSRFLTYYFLTSLRYSHFKSVSFSNACLYHII